jgi:hypothetical protein
MFSAIVCKRYAPTERAIVRPVDGVPVFVNRPDGREKSFPRKTLPPFDVWTCNP